MECDILKTEYVDSSTEVEAEFVSEETMKDEWNWSENLSNSK